MNNAAPLTKFVDAVSTGGPCRLPVLAASAAVMSLVLIGCATDGTEPESRPDREFALHDGEDTGSDASSGSTSADALEPPDGYSATDPDTILQLGQTAHVATSTNESEIQYWSITMQEPLNQSVDAVIVSSPTDGIDRFVCYRYRLTYLGSDELVHSSDSELVAPPDEENSRVSVPYLLPVNNDGETANLVRNGNNALCDVPDSQQVPSLSQDLEEGTTYVGAVTSYIRTDRKSGVAPTGVEIILDSTVPDYEDDQYIFWY